MKRSTVAPICLLQEECKRGLYAYLPKGPSGSSLTLGAAFTALGEILANGWATRVGLGAC
jgi:hypothetical protein